ncbi:hypothetical protein D3C77_462590 [compost metagenome]
MGLFVLSAPRTLAIVFQVWLVCFCVAWMSDSPDVLIGIQHVFVELAIHADVVPALVGVLSNSVRLECFG